MALRAHAVRYAPSTRSDAVTVCSRTDADSAPIRSPPSIDDHPALRSLLHRGWSPNHCAKAAP